MKISKTRICIDCEEVFADMERACPVCTSKSTIMLSKWVPPLNSIEKDRDRMRTTLIGAGISCCEAVETDDAHDGESRDAVKTTFRS
jgi:hypothetical protein